jgi:hypothetical protein
MREVKAYGHDYYVCRVDSAVLMTIASGVTCEIEPVTSSTFARLSPVAIRRGGEVAVSKCRRKPTDNAHGLRIAMRQRMPKNLHQGSARAQRVGLEIAD